MQSGMQVVAYSWGEDAAALLPAPDLVTGADIVYQTQHFAALIRTLQDLCAPHTIAYLAFKLRGEPLADFKDCPLERAQPACDTESCYCRKGRARFHPAAGESRLCCARDTYMAAA